MSVRDPLRCSTCDVLCHNADSAQTHCLGGRAALAVALRDDRARVVAVTARIIQRAQEREREQP